MRFVDTLKFAAFVALALLPASHGAAATLVYDEATDGDAGAAYLLIPPSGLPDVVLGIGVSTIRGTAGFGFDPDVERADAFRLILAPKTMLKALSVTVAAPVGTGTFSLLGWILSNNGDLADASYTQFGSLISVLTTPGTTQLGGGLPVPAGPLVFGSTGPAGIMFAGQSSTVDYEITLTVAPVPLPATLPLMVGALGLLAWRRSRRAD